MIGRQTVVALVLARAGSKGVPGKNHRIVAGRSLLERAIDCGRSAETVDRVVLSSDDPDAIATALARGCDVPFVRPDSLATDTASSMAVVRHALASLNTLYDLVVLLQPTSPLRIAADVDGAVRQCVKAGAPTCASVTVSEKPPQWMFSVDHRNRLLPVLGVLDRADRRQDLPASYVLNGAVFVAQTKWLTAGNDLVGEETVAYAMPKERSIDVDDEADLIVAEALAPQVDGIAVATRGTASSTHSQRAV